ncbi:discoidin domain-containing receptor 2-like [Schistocerca serialis cubense]|uniref:discoidin domain-containing receptor 2-like n=1 Tax=Schistocerca serialis cubense TaxID=2023355 RepID=UPI00214DFD5F|nr:discoidin domain-containing receptor 2-like [Schistocerca serialis cubense]
MTRAAAWLLLALQLAAHGLRLDHCTAPLGMESGAIADEDISASSAYDSSIVGARNSRLREDKGGGAWCPRNMVTRAAEEWLQVELHSLHAVTAVRTQGRFGHGLGQEYAENYLLDYWRPGLATWTRWRDKAGNKMLSGNTDTNTVVEQRLQPPVVATRVRVVPFSEHMRTVCMRLELVGCRNKEGLLSYSVAQGARGFTDRLYDGREAAGHLSAGLGTLSDGRKAQDLLPSLEAGQEHEWVGWRNDTPGMEGSPVEMLFEFDHVRNFSAVHLHANNQFSKDVQVFSHAKAFVSVSEQQHVSTEPVAFSYVADLLMEHPRDVTVKLHHRVGRFLRLQLYFAASWIVLSEISFDSAVVVGNSSLVEAPSEDPPQRDEVQQPPPPPPAPPPAPGQPSPSPRPPQPPPASAGQPQPQPQPEVASPGYIGPVISSLSTVIVLLAASILLIVLRHRRLKAAAANASPLPPPHGSTVAAFSPGDKAGGIKELQMRVNVAANGRVYGQLSLDDPEPPAPTHYQQPLYGQPLPLNGAPYNTGVPDVVSREYAVPLVRQTPPPSRRPPPFAGSEPPPVPPPPEQYYAATEICKGGESSPPPVPPPLPPLPPLAPGSPYDGAATGSDSAGLDELTTATEDEAADGDGDEEEDAAAGAQPLPLFPREHLRVVEMLGVGHFGDVHLCEVKQFPEVLDKNLCTCKLVAVKFLRPNASEAVRLRLQEEACALWRLRHPNLCQLLGASAPQDSPAFLVVQYSQLGDLNQFLQEHLADTVTSPPPSCRGRTLSYGCLIYMATQIAAGMKYLESHNFVHRDLAARNCLVGLSYEIKISDTAMCRNIYAGDYYKVDEWALLPIRWMAWESILMGKFTTKSDVWSFAVTLWEILTFAREQPFEELCDDKVIENVSHIYQDDGQQMFLPPPKNCPKEIYDLMCECWQRNESNRPNFREIHLFLQRKNLGYEPEMN